MSQESSLILPEGTIVGSYEIIKNIGKGGFGITYKARHIKTGIIRAIKEYFPSDYASRGRDGLTIVSHTNNKNGDKDVYSWGLKSFLEEAKTLGEFNYPTIVKIIDYFDANNTAYLVMEYYDGETLKKYLERNKNKTFSQDEILNIVMPILEGLKEVHSKGYLHRDIAPDNIFLRENYLPVLIDFGSSRNAIGNKSKTLSAIIKSGYSPPEQYTFNSKQNATADIYAICAVMYEMITGKRPPESTQRQTLVFNGADDPIIDIVSKHKNQYSKSFLETIMQGLALRANERIQIVKELQERLVEDSGTIIKEPPKKHTLQDLDDLIMMAGADKIITADEEAMILKKTKNLGLDEKEVKRYISEAIRAYGWEREEKESIKNQDKTNIETVSAPPKEELERIIGYSLNNSLPRGYKLLGEYSIVDTIGMGGFSIVYKAKDNFLDEYVVIKEYFPTEYAIRTKNSTILPTDDIFKWGLERFLDEAKTLRKFDHPSIVKVLRYFTDNNTAYIVMPFYEGVTLEKYLKKNKKLSQNKILDIIWPILEGLKEVHSKGFIHRDIAPDNIFLRKNKSPVLIDFLASRDAINNKSKTLSAIIKPGYSPPEQYDFNSNQDATTDIYAVCAVMYEMITGKRPPESVDRQSSLFNGETDPIIDIVSEYKDTYSISFLKTVQQGLELKQEDRPQSIEVFEQGLNAKVEFIQCDNGHYYENTLYVCPYCEKEAEEESELEYHVSHDILPRGYELKEYTILRVLGKSELGVVYKAKDNHLDTSIVIREYFPYDFASRDSDGSVIALSKEEFKQGLEEFISKARKIIRFYHPSLVTILALFEANNTAYVTMPYYIGETLDSHISKHNQSFSENEILKIMIPILDGVQELHKNGYLHGDIAPDNIFVRENDPSLLLGLESMYNKDMKNTTRIVKMGYTPPEQYVTGSTPDETTNIYALSAVMYEMITRKRPPEATVRQTKLFIGEADPIIDIVSEYQDRYSLPFLKTIQKGLNLKQQDRPQSVEELQQGLVDDYYWNMEEYKEENNSSKKSFGLFNSIKSIFNK